MQVCRKRGGGSFQDNGSQLYPMQGCRKRGGGGGHDNVSQLNPMGFP